ncbi:MAG TPA: tyrosine-protein phosphatase [Blastocatellia bacterium]|nr:tyrosine-protein phosphatase [Blastocatellia bacterium]
MAAVALALINVAQAAQHNTPQQNIKVKNFGCINEKFYRGAQPKGSDYEDLAAMGIKTIIDLQQDGERNEQRLVEGAGMNFYRIGLSDSSWPSPDKVDQFLKIVNEPANQPVFIHCHGGKHRAGIMTAVYRMHQDGWDADRAYAEMKQYDFESGFGHGGLKDFVYDYYSRMDKKGVVVKTDK